MSTFIVVSLESFTFKHCADTVHTQYMYSYSVQS
jgi:hypothetical protein